MNLRPGLRWLAASFRARRPSTGTNGNGAEAPLRVGAWDDDFLWPAPAGQRAENAQAGEHRGVGLGLRHGQD